MSIFGPIKERPVCRVCNHTIYGHGYDVHAQCAPQLLVDQWNAKLKIKKALEKSGVSGKKKCPDCQTLYGVRTQRCPCGYVFVVRT
jgi:hypothetical protein